MSQENPTTLSITSTLPLNSPTTPTPKIPLLGFGVCQSTSCTTSALTALQTSYRHLDTAQIYQNEHETGLAILQSPIPRSEIFLCSKLWESDLQTNTPTYTRSAASANVQKSLKALQTPYIDLYLLHSPRPGRAARLRAWLGLQDSLAAGHVRAIGVSNWSPAHIEELRGAEDVTTLPCVNQIEFHPWQQQREILSYCREHSIVVVAYSPLAQATRLRDPVVAKIAEKHRRTPAQVVLRWCLQMGVVVIPKSDREERIKENAGVFGWELGAKDMEALAGLDEGQKGNVGEWDPFAWE